MEFGLIGQAISNSLSPKIHTYVASRLGLLGFSYRLFPLASVEDLSVFLENFWRQGGLGLNITTPYKTQIAKLINSPLNSVNTLYRGEQYWQATSTDAEGFAAALAHLGKPLSYYRSIVVLGAGGAAQALVEHLAENQANQLNSLQILCRTPSLHPRGSHRSSSMSRLPLTYGAFSAEGLHAALAKTGEDSLLIQATNAPTQGDDLSYLCPALRGFKGAFVDLVYGKPSALFSAAQLEGLPAQDGLPMLIEQARLAQKVWWGKTLSYDEIFAHVHKELKESR